MVGVFWGGGKAVALRHGPMRVTPDQQSSIMSVYFIPTKSQFHPERIRRWGLHDEEGTQFAMYRVFRSPRCGGLSSLFGFRVL